ncbi:MAG: homocysteine S-methyltransferase [Acidaminococcaceae bacterium]|nr:homocysteine S-methyltransferase [Acidaminococcaceae bacterium]
MNAIEQILQEYPLLVLDGAFGTEVARRGFDTSGNLWAAKALFERPDLVKAVHRDYFEAGADIATSASYQATVEGFESKGFTHAQAAELIRQSVRLVQEAKFEFWHARNRNTTGAAGHGLRPYPLAAASVGPYGAYLADGSEYTGVYAAGRNELADFHAERLSLLLEEKPDILACETLPLLLEAEAILQEIKKYPDALLWISFSCKDGKHTCGGDLLTDCARFLDKEPRVAAVGVNCTDPDYVSELIGEIKKGTNKPVIVYPNRGETYDAEEKSWKGAPHPYHVYVKSWFESGARIIGGCCRTTPEDICGIAELRAALLRQ